MNDVGKFQRSWVLFRSSLSVIARNGQLLAFPIVIFSLTVLIVLLLVAPPLLRPTGHSYISARHWDTVYRSLFTLSANRVGPQASDAYFTPAAIVYLGFVYFASMFAVTFLNVAFYHEILAALSGERVSLRRGLQFATTRLKGILMWTLFAGLVGLIIRAIAERTGIIGRIIARAIGVAWSVAAVFVIPVIVCNDASPVAALQKSARILKRTWGEGLIGYIGLALANSFIFAGSLLVLVAALAVSLAFENYGVILVVSVTWLLGMFVWAYVTGVASQVYKGALYLYAADGFVSEPYSREMLDMAWTFEKEEMETGGKIKLSTP